MRVEGFKLWLDATLFGDPAFVQRLARKIESQCEPHSVLAGLHKPVRTKDPELSVRGLSAFASIFPLCGVPGPTHLLDTRYAPVRNTASGRARLRPYGNQTRRLRQRGGGVREQSVCSLSSQLLCGLVNAVDSHALSLCSRATLCLCIDVSATIGLLPCDIG